MTSKTPRPPSPSAQLSALLSRFSPKIAALARQSLSRIRRALPGTLQLVYDYPGSVVVSFGQSERGVEAIAAIAIYPEWVRLYFNDGKLLDDPKGLLQGSATRVRFVVIETASDIDQQDIQTLIKAAIKQSGLELSRSGTSRIVIKSATRKKKAKKAKKAKLGDSRKSVKPQLR